MKVTLYFPAFIFTLFAVISLSYTSTASSDHCPLPLSSSLSSSSSSSSSCFSSHKWEENEQEDGEENTDLSLEDSLTESVKRRKYILYDVNEGEGFNLRRDVYMRMVSLVRVLRETQKASREEVEWTLVLPPFGPLAHWKPSLENTRLPWSTFFDVHSLNSIVPVLEFHQFLKSSGHEIDLILSLNHFLDESNHWQERYEVRDCDESKGYRKQSRDNLIHGWFWSFEKLMAAKAMKCISVEGFGSTLSGLIANNFTHKGSIFVLNAEVVLHDNYGDAKYWEIRRSMRFNRDLIEVGNRFRETALQSNDHQDKTLLESDWRSTRRIPGDAKGGSYLGVHLRRGDFAYNRPKDVPTIDCAIEQIISAIERNKLENRVFIASDASAEEILSLEVQLENRGVQVFRYKNDSLLEGQLAIIDQWICAHAAYFIGTRESTFSFRIQEEREILGFHSSTTFNAFCSSCQLKGSPFKCKQESQWNLVY